MPILPESKYHVQTKTIAVDFTNCSEIYDKIRDEIQGLEIGTLGRLFITDMCIGRFRHVL